MFSSSPVVNEHIVFESCSCIQLIASIVFGILIELMVYIILNNIVTCGNEICNIFLHNARILSLWKFSKWSCSWRLSKNHFIGTFFQSAAYLSV